jgi:hypothetical protein
MIAIYQTPAIYTAWAYMLLVPAMVARDAYHSYFKLHNTALRVSARLADMAAAEDCVVTACTCPECCVWLQVLAECGAQLMLLALLDVFAHMIFLDPTAVPSSERAQGGCGPGPLVTQQQPGVQVDDTAAEVHSAYSEHRKDQDKDLPMLAGRTCVGPFAPHVLLHPLQQVAAL